MHTKRVKEISDNSPLKTDGKDPRVIADIIKLGRALSVVIPEGHAACLTGVSGITCQKSRKAAPVAVLAVRLL
jgi:hypothetical protein